MSKRRHLSGVEAGVILGVVLLVVLCCLGALLIGGNPAPTTYVPMPTATY